MKNTTFCQLFAIGALFLGGFSLPALADGPSELEALAEKARQAAEDTEAAEEEVEEATEEVAEEPKVEVAEGEKGAQVLPKEAADAIVDEVVKEMMEKANEEAANEKATEEKAAEEKAAEEEGVVKEAVVEEVKEIAVDPKVRAEKLGLLSNIDKDVAAVTTFNNGARIWEEIMESDLGEILLETFGENEIDLTDPESPAAQIAPLFQEEFLFTTGKGTPKQFANLIELSGLSDKYQVALMIELWATGMGDEEEPVAKNPFSSLLEAVRDDPDSLLNLISGAEMPPILLAARVSDDGERDEFAAALEMGAGVALGFAGEQLPFLESTEVEIAGVSFTGLSINGTSLVESMESDMGLTEMLESFLDPASAQDAMKSLAEKNLFLLGGVSDEAIYLYLGSSVEGIPLVEDVADGLASSSHFEFTNPYLDEKLVSLFWMEEEMVATGATAQGIFENYIAGVRLGLEGNDSVGDVKKLNALLDKLEKLEKGYLAVGQSQSAASVSFLKGDGLHTEGFGGYLDGAYDLETPHQMKVESEDAFLTVQSVVDSETSALSVEYTETAIETAYEMASLFAEMEKVPADLEEYLDGFQLFDTKLKGDALSLWKGLTTSGKGLGNESVFEIDMAGSWPTVPGVPERFVEEALAPRLSYVVPVTDRAQLASSWKEMEKAATKILKTAGEVAGEEIPMQRPMSSQNDGLKTWFFPLPFMTDDFIPSVTLNDDLLVMGTSKERAIELAQSLKKEGGETNGIVMHMNFEPLREFLSNWLSLVEENPQEVLTDEDDLAFFLENKETIKKAVSAMDEFDSWHTHTRIEDGELRTSSHFKTK